MRERLEYELGVIHQMGFDAYFLIVWDLCRYAMRMISGTTRAVLPPVRSLPICWISPWSSRSAHGLLFERFLNPDRISMPDIDLDFQDDRAPGSWNTAPTNTATTMLPRSSPLAPWARSGAIRDVGRVMDIPLVRSGPRHQTHSADHPRQIRYHREALSKHHRNSKRFMRKQITCAT